MDKEIAIETFVSLLKSDVSVELPASGYSMFPLLRPDDRAIVRPLSSEIPEPGTIIVIRNNDTLVMHRLVEIRLDNFGNSIFITRGDAMSENDKPWSKEQVLGVVTSFRRKNRQTTIKAETLSDRRYQINRILLRFYYKINAIRHIGR